MSEWLSREKIAKFRAKWNEGELRLPAFVAEEFSSLLDQAEALLDCQEALSADRAETIAHYLHGQGWRVNVESVRAYAAVLRRATGERNPE